LGIVCTALYCFALLCTALYCWRSSLPVIEGHCHTIQNKARWLSHRGRARPWHGPDVIYVAHA
jgi:hypothetical protein